MSRLADVCRTKTVQRPVRPTRLHNNRLDPLGDIDKPAPTRWNRDRANQWAVALSAGEFRFSFLNERLDALFEILTLEHASEMHHEVVYCGIVGLFKPHTHHSFRCLNRKGRIVSDLLSPIALPLASARLAQQSR